MACDEPSWDLGLTYDRRLTATSNKPVEDKDRPKWMQLIYKALPKHKDFSEQINKQVSAAWKDSLLQAEQLSPTALLDQQTKNKIKDKLKENAPKIVILCCSAAVYCSAFHEAKRGAKYITHNRRYIGRGTAYVCDVMLPTGLYGPIFGVLLRVALPF
ncbi:hypothetical protein WJX73_005284 [Symbiochloris irregularis]|uniref:Uncharacterized protein n=1 Tax=Symbiochloris irregularis TaxID=706552 RepID=A0AAW1PI43_9CHLO